MDDINVQLTNENFKVEIKEETFSFTFNASVGGGGGAVDSVNGKTGIVVLDADDVGADIAGSASNAEVSSKGYTDSKILEVNNSLKSGAFAEVLQEPGASETDTLSQKAITEAFNDALMAILVPLNAKVGSNGSVTNNIALTQSEYDALAVKDPNTLYFITDS